DHCEQARLRDRVAHSICVVRPFGILLIAAPLSRRTCSLSTFTRGLCRKAKLSRSRILLSKPLSAVSRGHCRPAFSKCREKHSRLRSRSLVPGSSFQRRRHETEFKARWVPLLPRESAKKTFNVGDRSLPERHALFPRRIDAWRA